MREPANVAPDLEPLGLAEAATTEEMFRLVVKAIDEGRVDVARGRLLLDAVKVRLPVVDAAEFRRKLALAEAKALEAAKLAGRAALPASRATVDLGPAKDGAAQ